MAAPIYHAAESCTKNFATFVEKVNPLFETRQRGSIISQFEKCILDRKADPNYIAAKEKAEQAKAAQAKGANLLPADYSHMSVVAMFQKLLDKIRLIREDRLSNYALELEITRDNAARIKLTPGDVAQADIYIRHVAKGPREVSEEQMKAEMEAEAEAEAEARAQEMLAKEEKYQADLAAYNKAHAAWVKDSNSIRTKNRNKSSFGEQKADVAIPPEPKKPVREGGRRRTRRKNGRRRTQKKRKTYV